MRKVLSEIKIFLRHLSVLLLSVLFLQVHGAEFIRLESDSTEHQHFLQLMKNNLQAWSFTKDDERFDEAHEDYSKRPEANFWDTAPPLRPYRGWTEYRMAAKNWSSKIDRADISLIRPQAFKAWRHKDVVWNLMYCRVALVLPNGETPAPLCRGTAIWEWEGDRWRLSHETFSAIVEPGQKVFQADFQPDPRVEVHAEFAERAAELASAWSNGNIEGLTARLKPFYLQSSELSVLTPWAPFEAYLGWQAVKAGLEENVVKPFRQVKLTLNNDLEAQQRGEITWTTATLNIDTSLRDGSTVSGDARQTLIWFFTPEGWRVIHEHFSFPST